MSNTIADQNITSATWLNAFTLSGIASTSAITIENKSNKDLLVQKKNTQPSASNRDGTILSPYEVITIAAGVVDVWLLGDGVISIQDATIADLGASETTLAAMSAKLPSALGQNTLANSISTITAKGMSSIADALAGLICWSQFSVAAVASQYSKFQMINPTGSGKTVIIFNCNVWGSSGTNVYSIVRNDTQMAGSSAVTSIINRTRIGTAAPATLFYKTNNVTAPSAPEYANTSLATATPSGTNILQANAFLVLPEGTGIEIDCNTVNIGMNMQISFSEF